MTEEIEVVNRSLCLTETYLREGKFGRAFAHLLTVLKLKPELKDNLENLFVTVLSNWDNCLAAEGRYSDLFTCYELALEYYNHYIFYNNLGTHLYRLGYWKEAIRYYHLAINNNNEYIPAIKNLYNLYNELVERWHFKMLNDVNRNDSFRKAISKKIKLGYKTVLDIGCGTGLLSLYAKIEGADKVYSCDYSEVMIDIAHNVLEANNFDTDKSVTLIPKLSNNLIIPEDIPSRCPLIVTETMDAGLFGERILQTLVHAWENLLLPNDISSNLPGQVIPYGATVYIVPIHSVQIAMNNYVLPNKRIKPPKKYHKYIKKLDKIKFCSKKVGPYDSDYLKNVEHYNLSEPVKVLTVNFNNLEELKSLLSGKKNVDNLSIKITKDGYVDALAVWFDLHLDDKITISSSPYSGYQSCWEQAIFPLKQPYFVEKDSAVNVNVGCSNGELRAKLITNSAPDQIEVPQEIVRFLNCKSLQEIYIKVLNKLNSASHKIETNEILDLSPFPFLGLLLNQQFGAKVTCVSDIKDFNKILGLYKVNPNNFLNINWEKLSTLLDGLVTKFDVIVLNFFQGAAEWKEKIIINLPKIRESLTSKGIIIPSEVSILGRLVDSPQLSGYSEVNNPQLMSEIRVAEFINCYKVPYHLDLKSYEVQQFKSLSEEFVLGKLNIEQLSQGENVVFEKKIKIIDEGNFNVILYWYECDYLGDKFSTRSLDSYIDLTCWLPVSDTKVTNTDKVKLKAVYNKSFLYFRNKLCNTKQNVTKK